MITYLINFILCSGLLLAVYHFFLRNENLYQFNRFYLLFSLAFSLIVPSITMEVYPAQPTLTEANQPVVIWDMATAVSPIITANHAVQQSVTPASAPDYLPYALIAIYSLITVVLLVRFTRNLYAIRCAVAKNAARPINNAKLVLVNDAVTPHSFLKYIFINKSEYEDGQIAPQIICHEQTHIKQLHSLDVILIELFQAICWFNPLIPFYRKAIQLNHEFLADEAVIKNYDNTPAYQYLLLSKAGQLGGLYLTSQFNYLATKKRLIMMTKNTTAATAWFARLAIIPVIAVTFLLFCNKTAAALAPVKSIALFKGPAPVKNNDTVSKKKLPRPPMPHLLINYPTAKEGASPAVLKEYAAIESKYDRRYYRNVPKIALSQADKDKLEELFKQMNRKQQEAQKIVFSYQKKFGPIIPTQARLDSCDNSLYAVWIDGERVKTSELKNHQPQEFSRYGIIKLPKVEYKSLTYRIVANFWTTAYFNSLNKRLENPHIVYYSTDKNGEKITEFIE